MTHARSFPRSALFAAIFGLCAGLALPSCAGREGKASKMARWLEDPTNAKKLPDGKWYWEDLGVTFEVPDTLYVFKECTELAHASEGDAGWIPVMECHTVGDSSDVDEFGAEESSGAEPIALKIYATKKTRPLDERTVTWFENQYKQAGFRVDEISYQHSFQNKPGIYAKLHVMDTSTDTPTREILQFMFPKQDIVFIARTEYPFGDTRAIEADWKYILWNFETHPELGEQGASE